MSHGEVERENPFSPPLADIGQSPRSDMAAEDDPVVLRNKFAGREALVRVVGLIYFVPILIAIFSSVSLLVASYRRAGDILVVIPEFLGSALVPLVIFWVWSDFRRLRLWAYWITVLLSLGSLLLMEIAILQRFLNSLVTVNLHVIRAIVAAFVVGQIPGGLLIFLLPSSTRSLFSARYRDVIERTPHIKPRLGARPFLILAGVAAFDIVLVLIFRFVLPA